ncbi:ER membrane glycoprotein subunit of the GPI transamidase complex-like protein [Sorochytrium milnesiophthora]
MSAQWLQPFDASTTLALADHPPSPARTIATALGSWDVHHFLSVALYGYVHEHQFAFFPLLPMASRWIAQLAAVDKDKVAVILSGALVSNVAFVLSALVLYRYTESIFTLLSLIGMLLFQRHCDVLAACVFAMSGLARSNGLLYCGFFMYRLLTPRTLAKVILCCIITVMPFAGFQYHAFRLFCKAQNGPEWCAWRVPLIYSYVQARYWDNGFLRYWRLSQIPNFLLAAPVWLYSALSIAEWWRQAPILDLLRQQFGSSVRSMTTQRKAALSQTRTMLPFVMLHLFVLLYATTHMHIQVLIRFTTCLPTMYWFGASLLASRSAGGYVWLTYCIVYGCVGAVLFALFYPPA